MGEYKLLVLSNPIPGEEEQFDRWYGNHLGELRALSPFLGSAARFRRVDGPGERPSHQHLVIADWHADDLAASWREHIASIEKATAARSFTPPPPAFDAATAQHWIFAPID